MLFFHYVVRKILRRLANNALTVGSIALVLAGCMLGVAFLVGLRGAVEESLPPEHVIVMSRGAIGEMDGSLSLDAVKQLEVLPGLRAANGRPLVSAETVGEAFLSTEETVGEAEDSVILRGVDPIALEIHRVSILAGRAPRQGERELMIGKPLARLHPELRLGSRLELPGAAWEIVGVFSAGGAVYEGEAWGDRSGLMRDLRQEGVNSVLLVMASPSDAEAMIRTIRESKRLEASAQLERTLRQSGAGLEQVTSLVFALVIMLCAIGLFVTATNVHASLVTRLPEFATMIAIGMRRSRVAWLVLEESLLLALMGGVIGLMVTFLAHGRSSAVIHAPAVFPIEVGPVVIAAGFALAVLVGLSGGLFPALVVRRLDLVNTLR